MTTPSEEEARAEADRINAWADDRFPADETAFGVDEESFIAGAMWAASRVSTPPSEDWEYGVARPASMPDMSGRDQYTLVVSTTFPTLEAAENARSRVPSLRDNPALIVKAKARGPWVPAVPVLPTAPEEEG